MTSDSMFTGKKLLLPVKLALFANLLRVKSPLGIGNAVGRYDYDRWCSRAKSLGLANPLHPQHFMRI